MHLDDTDHAELPEEAFLLALLHLDKLGPNRLTALLNVAPAPMVWAWVSRGSLPSSVRLPSVSASRADLLAKWRTQAASIDPANTWTAHKHSGYGMFRRGEPGFPARLANDPEPPEFLFVRGSLPSADVPTVAIVGTRRCSANGRRVAADFGRDLAEAGVSVISGLALGIDAAAHRGAVSVDGGPPVAVIATGLDLSYPRQTAGLAEDVATAGAIVSEYPLGTRPTTWRFPARNRIIAALADVVVVVESARTGGSMHTVNEAIARDVAVLAVPGPVGAASAEGTNTLLFDGCGPARSAGDVLDYLGLFSAPKCGSNPDEGDTALAGDPVLDAVDWWPTSIDELMSRTRIELAPLSIRLEELVRSGRVVSHGSSFERRR